MNGKKEDRYQYQPWYICFWRRRYYIMIPYTTFKFWKGNKISWKLCWSIAMGIIQYKMNWVYDWEEVKERLEKVDNKHVD